MSAPTVEVIAPEEGDPFHVQAIITEHLNTDEAHQAGLIPPQSPAPALETIEPPFVVPEIEPRPSMRSRSLRELAADEAERLGTRIDTLQAELNQIRTELADPLAVDLLHSSDTERTIMRTAIGNITESIAAATRARKAALRLSGQRLGMAALSE